MQYWHVNSYKQNGGETIIAVVKFGVVQNILIKKKILGYILPGGDTIYLYRQIRKLRRYFLVMNYHQRLSPADLPTASTGGHAQCTPSVTSLERLTNHVTAIIRSLQYDLQVSHSPSVAAAQPGKRWRTLIRLF